MTDKELEAELRAVLNDSAQSVHADEATVQHLLHARPAATAGTPGRHASWLGPLLAAAAVLLVAAGVLAITRSTEHHPSAAPATTPVEPHAPSTAVPARRRVHVTSVITDGETVGVGMPIVLRLSPAPTDSSAFTQAASVTVDGRPAAGAWFWEQPTADDKRTHTIEAHYRPKTYWPADATIRLNLPIAGLAAGDGMVYDSTEPTLAFRTGEAHVSLVDGATQTMVVRSNDTTVKTLKVSLGKANTPTYAGVKIVMQKGEPDPTTGQLRPDGNVRLVGPGYDLLVPWSVRLTASGEYVLAAPWNSQIGSASTSNGTTDLSTADARWFYGFSRVGDVVRYVHTGGATAPSWDGYGDWNIPWSQWRSGGLLRTHD